MPKFLNPGISQISNSRGAHPFRVKPWHALGHVRPRLESGVGILYSDITRESGKNFARVAMVSEFLTLDMVPQNRANYQKFMILF